MRATVITLAAVVVSGCAMLGEPASRVDGDEEHVARECKIEGSQVGTQGLVLRLGSTSVTFRDWVTKAGEPGEYLGFSLEVAGSPVGYLVKAGRERYASSDRTWLHPGGARANAISNVDFCEDCPGCGGGGGGGGCEGGGDGCGSGSGSGSGPIL